MARLEFPAIRFTQHGRSLFLLAMEAGILLNISDVDTWNPDLADENTEEYIKNQGYQRATMPRHFVKVSSYVSKSESILPTSILLSSRHELEFVSDQANSNVGWLKLTDQDLPLWVVDGQHRLRGINYAVEERGKEELLDFLLPVCIMDSIKKYEEISQFQIINTTAKRLRTDLADRLLLTMAEMDKENTEIPFSQQWRLQATAITSMMNQQAGSPWEGRIRAPNTPSGTGVISERSFSTSLKPILHDGTMQAYEREDIVGWLTAFWKTVAELMPEAFESPREYAIQKTPGVYTFHIVVPQIFGIWLVSGERGREGIAKILTANSVIQEYFSNADYWRSGSGEGAGTTGMSGFARLAKDIAEVLPSATLPNIGSFE